MECSVKSVGDKKFLQIDEYQDTPEIAARHAALLGVANTHSLNEAENEDSGLPADGGMHRHIPIEAIASFSQLLGNGDDYEKTVREIMYISDHGEPAPDPVTDRNAWTSAYEQIAAEQANGGISLMSMDVSQSGIEQTRAALGLPSNVDSDVSVMSLEDDPTGIESYSLDDNVKSSISSVKEEIDAEVKRFLEAFKPMKKF